MKNYQYLEINPIRGIISTIAYIIVLVAAIYLVFGSFGNLADVINNLGSPRAVGLIVGMFCIAPIILLMKLFYPKINITINNSEMIINSKSQTDTIIRLKEISGLVLNEQKLNTLKIYGKNADVLLYMRPFNNHHILQQLINDITTKYEFRRTIIPKRFFKIEYDAITYERI